MRNFKTQCQFPNACGAMDGKHVIIRASKHTGSHFFNYKKNFGTILFAVVDANYNVLYNDVGTNGRVNDAAVFAKSSFNVALEHNLLQVPTQGVIIGDDAFPLRTNLFKPYPRCGLLNQTQLVFNYRLSRARRVVENAFGILVSRFRIFEKPLPVHITTCDCTTGSAGHRHQSTRPATNRSSQVRIGRQDA